MLLSERLFTIIGEVDIGSPLDRLVDSSVYYWGLCREMVYQPKALKAREE